MNLLTGPNIPGAAYFGHCLDVMRERDRGQADPIYLDSPFEQLTR